MVKVPNVLFNCCKQLINFWKMASCSDSKSVIQRCSISTPLGAYIVEACDKGLHCLHLDRNVSDENFEPQSVDNFKDYEIENIDGRGQVSGTNSQMHLATEWLVSYFSDAENWAEAKAPALCFPSDKSTEFERKVWNTLKDEVNFGKRITYAKLAESVGNPKASRAVGTAMKKNPVALIVPCHRVIRSDGKIGNYAAGKCNNVKQWLLDHEQ